MITLSYNTVYVVRFENGRYFYAGDYTDEGQTDDLQIAKKYVLDWQPTKDMYLMIYLNEHPMKYDVIKVKQHFEIID